MTDLQELVDKLVRDLPGWLPAQRWFAGKDRPVNTIRPLRTTVLRESDPLLLHVIVEVEQDDRRDPYQLLIGSRHDLPEHLGSSWIGTEGGTPCYEASADPDLTGYLLEYIAEQRQVDSMRFEHEPDVELESDLRSRPIASEQSNTSLVYGHHYILKLFRKLSPGMNPDLRLHRALHEVGCKHIAQPLGWITDEMDGQPVTIGMLQQFLPDAVDGWAMATTSVRDLMAEGDLHAYEVGGDFAGESQRLGQTVANVHADLQRALGRQEAAPGELEKAVQAMHQRLDTVLDSVPELAPYVPALRDAFDRALGAVGAVAIQSIHGDLHLGQVLRTVNGWVLIDFEGEPAAPLAERNALRSPLRDIAGMLRSFDYAASQMLVGQPEENTQLTKRALEWSRRNRTAFCEGYAEVAADSVSDPRQHSELLRAFELDKAVYEVAYEHANRPEWLTVPLSSIARIITGGE